MDDYEVDLGDSGSCDESDEEILTGDFNGDGNGDLACYDHGNGVIVIRVHGKLFTGFSNP
jgi:hypothetical protein